jgi:hypothetical protein
VRRVNGRVDEMRQGGVGVKFYTIKLPKFLGGMIKVLLGIFSKEK